MATNTRLGEGRTINEYGHEYTNEGGGEPSTNMDMNTRIKDMGGRRVISLGRYLGLFAGQVIVLFCLERPYGIPACADQS